MQKKTCLITGGNAGIGKATAQKLAQRGHRVILTGRHENKLKAAQQELRQATNNEKIDIAIANFASIKAVESLAQHINSKYDDLHILVNNAGLFSSSRQLTEDGHELVFQVNHLAHFLLTHRLLDQLKASAPARILNVSSGLHKVGKIDFDDLRLEKSYNGLRAYGRSKLANILFTYELDRRLEGDCQVTVNAVNPKAVDTGLVSKHSDWLHRMVWSLYRFFIKSTERGAETPFYVATSPELEGVSGYFFEKKQKKTTSKSSYDENLAQKLWDVSAQLTGLKE